VRFPVPFWATAAVDCESLGLGVWASAAGELTKAVTAILPSK